MRLERLNLLDNILTHLPVSTRNPKPRIRNPKPETRNPKSEIRNLKHQVEICDLSTLLELSVGYNRMVSIHPKIGALENLQR